LSHGERRLEDLLDVVDIRTVNGLLMWAGFAGRRDMPTDVEDYLARQTLVRDQCALQEVRRAMPAVFLARTSSAFARSARG
jgi:hypothetical protein